VLYKVHTNNSAMTQVESFRQIVKVEMATSNRYGKEPTLKYHARLSDVALASQRRLVGREEVGILKYLPSHDAVAFWAPHRHPGSMNGTVDPSTSPPNPRYCLTFSHRCRLLRAASMAGLI
jgi:hypothetical protein